MKTTIGAAIGLVIALLAAYSIGWGFAHTVVALECKRLGAFYVGDVVYRCHPTATEKE